MDDESIEIPQPIPESEQINWPAHHKAKQRQHPIRGLEADETESIQLAERKSTLQEFKDQADNLAAKLGLLHNQVRAKLGHEASVQRIIKQNYGNFVEETIKAGMPYRTENGEHVTLVFKSHAQGWDPVELEKLRKERGLKHRVFSHFRDHAVKPEDYKTNEYSVRIAGEPGDGSNVEEYRVDFGKGDLSYPPSSSPTEFVIFTNHPPAELIPADYLEGKHFRTVGIFFDLASGKLRTYGYRVQGYDLPFTYHLEHDRLIRDGDSNSSVDLRSFTENTFSRINSSLKQSAA